MDQKYNPAGLVQSWGAVKTKLTRVGVPFAVVIEKEDEALIRIRIKSAEYMVCPKLNRAGNVVGTLLMGTPDNGGRVREVRVTNGRGPCLETAVDPQWLYMAIMEMVADVEEESVGIHAEKVRRRELLEFNGGTYGTNIVNDLSRVVGPYTATVNASRLGYRIEVFVAEGTAEAGEKAGRILEALNIFEASVK